MSVEAVVDRALSGDLGAPAQPFVFISHASQDSKYVQRLVEFLGRYDIAGWADDQIATGQRWDRVLQRYIDACSGLVVVMSPAAQASHWVAEEVHYALSLGKPVLPLLLDGQILFGLHTVQHEKVTYGRLPSATLVARLRDILAGTSGPYRRRCRVGLMPAAADCFRGPRYRRPARRGAGRRRHGDCPADRVRAGRCR